MADSEETTQILVRVPSELVQEVERIAVAAQQSPDWVITRALKYYSRDEGADILSDAEGLAALDRGKSRDFDEVTAEGQEIIRRAETARESAEKLAILRREINIGVEDAAAGRFSKKTVKELAEEVRREQLGD